MTQKKNIWRFLGFFTFQWFSNCETAANQLQSSLFVKLTMTFQPNKFWVIYEVGICYKNRTNTEHNRSKYFIIKFIRWFHEFSVTSNLRIFKKLTLLIYSYVCTFNVNNGTIQYPLFNLFVTSKNETTNSQIHEFKVLIKGQRAF